MELPPGSVGKKSCSAGDTGDPGLSPGSGRFPGGGNGKPLQYSCLAWRILWTEEPGGLQSRELKRDMTERLTLTKIHSNIIAI